MPLAALRRWLAPRRGSPGAAPDEASEEGTDGASGAPSGVAGERWVVVDVESSGLDTRRDRLLAIAGVGLRVAADLRAMSLEVDDSFECVLRQPEASARDGARENILVHHIGVHEQIHGVPPADALLGFERWVGAAPLFAFHAGFDRAMIERGFREVLGRVPRWRWLDIEPLARMAMPKVKAKSLDDWLGHFRIVCPSRHRAIADTWVSAELLMALRSRIATQARSLDDLARLLAQEKWLR